MNWFIYKTEGTVRHWVSLENGRRVSLRYNKSLKTFRLNLTEKRIFFLGKAGWLNPRIVLTTEYHVEAGSCLFFKNKRAGALHMGAESCIFRIDEERLSFFTREKRLIDSITIHQLDKLDIFELAALVFASAQRNYRHFSAISYAPADF